MRWYQTGLVIPDEIPQAIKSAREEMDPFRAFLKEECVIDPRCYNAVVPFRQKYDEWAAVAGQRYTLDRRRFDRALEAKDFQQGVRKINGSKARCWLGVKWVGQDEQMREIALEALYPKPTGLLE